MLSKCRRKTALFLFAVMLFMELAPFVHAADPDAGGDGPEVYSNEWCALYGVDTDLESYDPSVPEPGTDGDALGIDGENAHTIYGFLRSNMGLHSAAAVGILANCFAESSFRPDAVGDGGTSYGICQWHAGRWEKLKNFCDSNGLDWHSLNGQLHYLKHECDNDYPNTMDAIRNKTGNDADGAYRSAYLFCKNFEVPADTIAKSEQRGALARDKFWPIYGEPDADNPAAPTPTPVPEEPVEVIPVPDDEDQQPAQEDEVEDEEQTSSVLEEDVPEDGVIPTGLWFAGLEDKDYTGNAVKQEFRLYNSSHLLKDKTDYTVSYSNNKTAGTAYMTVSLKGNYSGTIIKTFEIKALDLKDADADDITLKYTGKEQKPKPEVSMHGVKLKYEKDFYIPAYSKSGFTGSESGNVSVSIDICGRGNYCGKKTISINYIGKTTDSKARLPQIMMGKVKAVSVPNQEYKEGGYSAVSLSQNNLLTKKGTPFEIKLKYKGKTLSENDVEVVGIEGGDMPGKAYIIIRGSNCEASATGYSFIGEKKIGFKVKGRSIGRLKISGIEKKYPYTGEEIRPVPQISGISGLKEGDYSVSYENNIMPGKATLIVRGEGIYTGVKKKSFKITGLQINSVSMDLYYDDGTAVSTNEIAVDYKRDGAFIRPALSFNGAALKEGTDYKLAYSGHKKAGNATMTVKGMGRFEGTVNVRYKVIARDFKSNIRMFAADKTAGDGFKQPVFVTDIDGTRLVEGRDYTAPKYYYRKGSKLYSVRSKDVPVAGQEVYVFIKGMGGYSRDKAFTKYKIVKAAGTLSKAKFTIKDQVYTGNAIRIKSQDQFSQAVMGDKTLILGVDFKIVPGSYENNVNKGTAKVTIKGCGEYGGQKTLTFKITARGT